MYQMAATDVTVAAGQHASHCNFIMAFMVSAPIITNGSLHLKTGHRFLNKIIANVLSLMSCVK